MRGRTGYFSISWKMMRSIATGPVRRLWSWCPIPGRPHRPASILLLGTALLLAGCADMSGSTARPFLTSNANVTPVQACAIGYDLARQIHDRVSPRRTVLLAPSRATTCEAHALAYLRRAGFRIDETGQGGARFTIALAQIDPETLSAVARIGDALTIARTYRPARTGVVAIGPVSVQHLDPDRYDMRDTAGDKSS